MYPEPMRAIVVGGAATADRDYATLCDLIGGEWDGLVVAVNDAGTVWPGDLHHWASLHPYKFQIVQNGTGEWLSARARNGLAPAGMLWGAQRRSNPPGVTFLRNRWTGGSSGLYGVEVAMHAGASHIVLVGVPLDYSVNAFRGEPWSMARAHRPTWEKVRGQLGAVRSLSGWTADLLGLPTDAWVDEMLRSTAGVPNIAARAAANGAAVQKGSA